MVTKVNEIDAMLIYSRVGINAHSKYAEIMGMRKERGKSSIGSRKVGQSLMTVFFGKYYPCPPSLLAPSYSHHHLHFPYYH